MGVFLFYAGIGVAGAAVLGAAVAAALLRRGKKKLDASFDAEYGKRGH